MKKSYEQLKTELASRFKFIEFSLQTVGDYLPEDVDWNYKDVPHLNIVHSQVDSIQAFIGKKTIATINMQKVFFMTLPLVVYNYEFDENQQIYFTSMGPFIVLIRTEIGIEDSKTFAKTTYCICSNRLLSFALPVLKTLLTRNYKILMSEDKPMRDRRGVLRKHRHTFFKPDKSYNFDFTTKISLNNIRLSSTDRTVEIDVKSIAFREDGEILGEPEGVLSFVVVKKENESEIWPTTCPHEGAKITPSKCKKYTTCPWHGRAIKPIGSFYSDGRSKLVNSKDYKLALDENRLLITYIQPDQK